MTREQQDVAMKLAMKAFADRLESIYGREVALVLLTLSPGVYSSSNLPNLNIVSNIADSDAIRTILLSGADATKNSVRQKL